MSYTRERADGTVVEYLTCAETAKLLRAELKQEFPGVKFSVRSKVYSGGASIDVRWTGGPSSRAVNRIAQGWAGATFDGMIDLKEYKGPVETNGRLVSRGADFVFCKRTPETLSIAETNELVGELLATNYWRPIGDFEPQHELRRLRSLVSEKWSDAQLLDYLAGC